MKIYMQKNVKNYVIQIKKFIKKTSNDNSLLCLIQTNHDNLKINMNMNTFMPMYILQYHGIITKLSEAKRKLQECEMNWSDGQN